jgi:phosphoribosylformimino-5-aminoimidazole carboxamide ribotide isomerase
MKIEQIYGRATIAAIVTLENNMVRVAGKEFSLEDYLNILKKLNIERIMFKDASYDNTENIPDFGQIIKISEEYNFKISIGNGINNYQSLRKAQEIQTKNIDSAIIGKALYDNKFPCQKIWRLAEADLEKKLIK